MSAVTHQHAPFNLIRQLGRLARAFTPPPVPADERRREAEIARAVDELGRYSDRQLAELGIVRDEIEEVVRYGRRGIERPAR